MQFYFTEEDQPTNARATDIRAALVHARHRVIHGRVGEPAPQGTDVWMHGIAIEGSPPMAKQVAEQLLAKPIPFGIFQLCDGHRFCFEQIPPEVTARASLFLRNHWPHDKALVPADVQDRVGWFPPMLKAREPHAGEPLARRSIGTIFYGTRTGFSNLGEGKNARQEFVRAMRASDLPFRGGLLVHRDPRYPVPPELAVAKVKERTHDRLLRDAQICLAPWGNHPITYRFFEGLSARCLVVAQSIRDATFVDGGLEAGKHYVEVASDLHDLTDVVRYYLAHLDEAQRIADAGHRHFREHFAARGKLISSYIFEATVKSWGSLYRPSDAHDVATVTRSFLARQFPDRY